MSKEHIDSLDCWCHPNEYDGVIVHRSELQYAIYELRIIGDICEEYGKMFTADALQGTIGVVKERARTATSNLQEMLK
jgi:hypothetical protein